MAKAAVKTKDIPEYATAISKRQARNTRRGALITKTFGELTGQEKDDLLKAIGLELGLIKEDP